MRGSATVGADRRIPRAGDAAPQAGICKKQALPPLPARQAPTRTGGSQAC